MIEVCALSDVCWGDRLAVTMSNSVKSQRPLAAEAVTASLRTNIKGIEFACCRLGSDWMMRMVALLVLLTGTRLFVWAYRRPSEMRILGFERQRHD